VQQTAPFLLLAERNYDHLGFELVAANEYGGWLFAPLTFIELLTAFTPLLDAGI
jgi:hypothetical protein